MRDSSRDSSLPRYASARKRTRYSPEITLRTTIDGSSFCNSIRKGDATAFYQGAIACAFNDVHRCEKKFRYVFNSAPRSDEAVEAHRTLASAYLTHGEYGKKALAQVDAILALRPTDADALGGHPVLSAALADTPDQRIAGRHTTVKLEDRSGIAVLNQPAFARPTGSTRERRFLY